MTTEDKLIIIRRWCYSFDINNTRNYAKISYQEWIGAGNFEYTPEFGNYDDLIDTSYSMVNDYVWNKINDNA